MNEVMDAAGVRYVVRELNEQEYREKLNDKLREELDEYAAADEADQVKEITDWWSSSIPFWKIKVSVMKSLRRCD